MSTLIKCLVWDLDNTIWSGTLMEKGGHRLKPGLKGVLEELDRRGILLSIASANDEDLALEMMRRKRISHFFLYPQINWCKKVGGLRTIAKALRIGLDSMGFIDDEPYELALVRSLLPQVSVYAAAQYRTLLERPEFNLAFLTEESRARRRMYLQESARAEAQKGSGMSYREFLCSSRIEMTISGATERDLPRVLELMHRTHQLNAAGIVYGEQDIARFIRGDRYRTYVVELKDRFVDYGKIGVAICARGPKKWQLFSFLLSCRVLTRGIGGVVLSWLQCQAYARGAKEFEGVFMKRERNHRMRSLYTLSGFRPKHQRADGAFIFARECRDQFVTPEWLTLRTGGA